MRGFYFLEMLKLTELLIQNYCFNYGRSQPPLSMWLASDWGYAQALRSIEIKMNKNGNE